MLWLSKNFKLYIRLLIVVNVATHQLAPPYYNVTCNIALWVWVLDILKRSQTAQNQKIDKLVQTFSLLLGKYLPH